MPKEKKTKHKKHIKTKKPSVKSCCEEILCAGFGGQGIMFMGKLLALSGLISGKYVTWMPSYGAEVRGGTAYSVTKVSTREIANPIISHPAVIIVMNKPSLEKYEGRLKEGGLLICNRSLAEGAARKKGSCLINIPMTEMASKLGSVKCANMIAVGALAKRSKMLTLRNILNALKLMLKGKDELFIMNKKAVEKGYRLA